MASKGYVSDRSLTRQAKKNHLHGKAIIVSFYLVSAAFSKFLNYIKQNGLKDNVCLTLHQAVEVLHPHEYGILPNRVGILQGLC